MHMIVKPSETAASETFASLLMVGYKVGWCVSLLSNSDSKRRYWIRDRKLEHEALQIILYFLVCRSCLFLWYGFLLNFVCFYSNCVTVCERRLILLLYDWVRERICKNKFHRKLVAYTSIFNTKLSFINDWKLENICLEKYMHSVSMVSMLT